MKAGDIVFTRGKGLVSRLIRLFDRGDYTHVAIAVSSTHVIEAQRFVTTRLVKMDYEEYDVLDLNLTPAERQQAIIAAHQFLGRRYDYLQIGWHMAKQLFGLKGTFVSNNPNTLICSELVSRVLHEIGYMDHFDTLYELTPNQLYDTLLYLAENRRPV